MTSLQICFNCNVSYHSLTSSDNKSITTLFEPYLFAHNFKKSINYSRNRLYIRFLKTEDHTKSRIVIIILKFFSSTSKNNNFLLNFRSHESDKNSCYTRRSDYNL